jgi:TPR repeat protein
MKDVRLVCAYCLIACGLACMQSAIAECTPESVSLVGTEQAILRGASSDSLGQLGQSSQVVSPTDYLAGADGREMLNRLAIGYAQGRGLPRKPRLALELFRTLAAVGYTPAMVNLGTIYELGLAGRHDHRRAYAWIRAGLTLGVPEKDRDATVFKLGMIAAGLGTKQTRTAERLATSITEFIAAQCDHWDQTYAEAAFAAANP